MEWILKVSENIIQYVTAASNGDTDAMAKLYSRTLKASYFLAATLCSDKQGAADITKKAYARAFCTIDKLKKPEAFEIWMKQNVSAIYKETQKFTFADADAGAVENLSEFLPESVLEDESLSEKVLAAVSSLKPELKTAFVLHYNNGMPVQALAKFLAVSESTANALLGKARAFVLDASGIDASTESAAGTLPVITRLFQSKAAQVTIDNKDVRDIFIYAIDAYEASRPAQPVVETPAEEVSSNEESVDEVPAEETNSQEISEEETASEAEEESVEETQSAPDNIIDFKQRISNILDSEGIASEDGDISSGVQEDEWKPAQTDDVDVPEIPVSEGVSESALQNFGGISINDENPPKNDNNSVSVDKPAKKINPKLIAIVCAAVLILVLAIVGISKLAGSGDDNPGGNVGSSNNISSSADDVDYLWQPGGFSECTEIGYLDEDAAYFKSAATGKYGLIDYQGNVILQPNYDGFNRCSNGREYSDRDSYHSLVLIGNEEFEITVTNGVVSVSEEPHLYHTISTEKLEDTSYVERDRYFEGYAAAMKDDKWGYVSQDKDKKVIPYEYEAVNELVAGDSSACDYCRPVTDGLIAVKKDGKMGIINLENDEVVPFEYSNIMPGSKGVFIACKDGIWGVILVGDAKTTFAGVNLVIDTTPPDVTASAQDDETIGKYKVVREGGLNIRDGAGAEYDTIGELDEGTVVSGYATKTAENGNKWLKIKYNGEYGWISMNLIEPAD